MPLMRLKETSTGRLGSYNTETKQFTPDADLLPTVPPFSTPVPSPPPVPTKKIDPSIAISPEDRRRYALAAPGTPEGAAARKGIIAKYGGDRPAFERALEPVSAFMGQEVLPRVIGRTPEQLATNLIMLTPGAGIPMGLARVAAATGAGGAISAAKGGDPLAGALEQGGTALVGETLGGVARGALRLGQAAWSRTTEKVGNLIGDLVPAFRGKSPAETVRRVISGEGQTELGRQYGKVIDGIIEKAKDPLVRVPSLVELGRPGPTRNFPELMRASTALRHIQGVARAGRPEQMGLVRGAREEFEEALKAILPPESQQAFAAAGRAYARGKAIEDWFGEGKAAVKNLLSKGRLNEPAVEEAFLASRGGLSRVFTPEEFRLIESVVRRGARAPLAITEPGGWRRLPMPVGGRGMPLPLPKAAIRVGRPEDIAEIGARGVRMLGQRVGQEAIQE